MDKRSLLAICDEGHTSRVLGHLQSASNRFEWSRAMAHLFQRNLLQRANAALVLGILWTALAGCVLGALAYDIHYWFESW
jgi:hypothetical protein